MVFFGAMFVLQLIGTVNGDCGIPDYVEGFIAGGKDVTDAGKWPWMVSLQYKTHGHFCGGALISPQWVLTAAHCLEDFKEEDIRLLFGSLDLSSDSERSRQIGRAKRFIIRPDYKFLKGQFYLVHDIALIELLKPVKLTREVKPICLPDPSTFRPGNLYRWTNCHIVGLGMKRNSGLASDVLQELKATLINDNMCAEIDKRVIRMIEEGNSLCAFSPEGGVICMGDSGGPIVCQEQFADRWYTLGAASWGVTGCSKNKGIFGYAEVVPYVRWIQKNCNCLNINHRIENPR